MQLCHVACVHNFVLFAIELISLLFQAWSGRQVLFVHRVWHIYATVEVSRIFFFAILMAIFGQCIVDLPTCILLTKIALYTEKNPSIFIFVSRNMATLNIKVSLKYNKNVYYRIQSRTLLEFYPFSESSASHLRCKFDMVTYIYTDVTASRK